jgi:hypothetical protein
MVPPAWPPMTGTETCLGSSDCKEGGGRRRDVREKGRGRTVSQGGGNPWAVQPTLASAMKVRARTTSSVVTPKSLRFV